MSAQTEFHAALASCDVRLVRKASAKLFPHLPQPHTYADAEKSMHMSRTQLPTLSDSQRLYSHQWLTERGLPSQLPDELRPKAERVHPVIAEGVMVAVLAQTEEMRPFAQVLERAMSDAVADAYANGDTAPAIVKDRMQAARSRTYRDLLGTTAGAI
jgi:hypothetical protein